MQTLSVLNPFRTTDQTILQDTDMAGPLVFCLTLGSFLLLVSKFGFHFFYVNASWNRSIRSIQLDFYLPTEWQSAFLIHLRHRRARLHCVLCSFDGDGNTSIGYVGCSHFSARILPTSNGRTIRHQCTRGSTVSANRCAPAANASTSINWYFHFCRGAFGIILAAICILWCSMSASKLFVTAYSMDHQQILIAYPCALLYGVFALITIF